MELEDDGTYQCQASPTNDGQPALRSRFARLSVLVPPQKPKILQGDFLVTTEDRELVIECISVAGKPPAEVRNLSSLRIFWHLCQHIYWQYYPKIKSGLIAVKAIPGDCIRKLRGYLSAMDSTSRPEDYVRSILCRSVPLVYARSWRCFYVAHVDYFA